MKKPVAGKGDALPIFFSLIQSSVVLLLKVEKKQPFPHFHALSLISARSH